jgi:hypothetical protein
MTQPTKRRHCFRVSLRMLLLVMTVFCVWLGTQVNAARRQREAVAAILSVGGEIMYDYQWIPVPGKPDEYAPDLANPPPMPSWLRWLVGDDVFRSVTDVTFHGCKLTWSDSEHIAELTNLERLQMYSVTLWPNNDGFAHNPGDKDMFILMRLRRLRQIILVQSEMTEEGIRRFQTAHPEMEFDIPANHKPH